MPRQLGPKGRSDLRTTVPHRSHASRIALPVIASRRSGAIWPSVAAFLGVLNLALCPTCFTAHHLIVCLEVKVAALSGLTG
jgi:hypothetical protein